MITAQTQIMSYVFILSTGNRNIRSSHQRCSIKKAVLKNFAIFLRKHLFWSLFLIKLQTFRSTTLIKRLQHRCFPVNIANFLKPILKNICKQLLLKHLFNPLLKSAGFSQINIQVSKMYFLICSIIIEET